MVYSIIKCSKCSNLKNPVLIQGDLEALIRTLRRLLAAVTRILLLADNVVVKQLLVASNTGSTSTMDIKQKGSKSGNSGSPATSASKATATVNNQAAILASMSTMHHFNEFVKAFCDFGSDMVHLIRISTGLFLRDIFCSNFFLPGDTIGTVQGTSGSV